jgi:ribonuclease P protein component
MLPKKNRLQLRHHQTFFVSATKKHTKHFVVFIEKAAGVTKAAIIVPAKKVPLAVSRIKHKRLIRAALQLVIKNSQQSQKVNIVVYCKRRFDNTSLSEIVAELTNVL